MRKQIADQTFMLQTPRDVLDMLEWQFAELQKSTGQTPKEAAYRMIQASITAWQMCDWAFDFIPEDRRSAYQAGSSAKPLARFQEWVKTRSQALAILRVLADASKHRNLTRHVEPETVTDELQFVTEDGDPVLYWAVTDKEGKIHSLPTLVKQAVEFWLSFLSEIGALERSQRARKLGNEVRKPPLRS